jgi:non-specific serine/threonine protein kinase
MSTVVEHEASMGVRGVPHATTSLVGRTGEAAAILALVADAGVRLITLVGPGGVGKTRLAAVVAQHAPDQFPDGVAFVDLAAITDPALVPTVISATLGLPDRGPDSCSTVLINHVSPRRMLLVLDNLEHLLPAVSLVSDLLAAAPGLTVLATSRVLLRLSGEHAYPVPPLDVPTVRPGALLDQFAQSDAVRLFLDRARAVRPALELNDETAKAIARICELLDGLPLAIELAAARANVLSPQAMVSRLERRLPLLTGGARDRPLRQQTMQDAIAWSFDLLTADEQALFRRLSIFVGSFTLGAAEAVTGAFNQPGIDVLEGIGSLVDKSLLRAWDDDDESPRFAMLETIREYALEQLEQAGEAAATADAHADWFLALAGRADAVSYTPGAPAWYGRLKPDRPNFRAALAWLHAHDPDHRFIELSALLGRFWYKWERFTEGLTWLEAAVAIARRQAPSRTRAELLDNLGKLTSVRTRHMSPIAYFAESLETWVAVGDARGIARETITLAEGYRLAMDAERAIPLYERGLELISAFPAETSWRSTALRGLATVQLQRGNVDRAEQLFEQSFAVALESDVAWSIGTAHHGLGQIASLRGHHAAAITHFVASIRIMRDLHDRLALLLAIPALGDALVQAAQFERAAHIFGASDAFSETLPDVEGTREMLSCYVPVIATARARLGQAAYSTAWAIGRGQPVADLVAFALAQAQAALADLAGQVPEPRRPALPGGLSEREAEVLRLAAAGLSNVEMAERLYLSPHTIRAHLQRIYAKLEVENRAAAVRFAVENGMV